MPTSEDSVTPPTPLLVIAAVLALGLAVAAAIIGLTGDDAEPRPEGPRPLPLPAVDAPDAGSSRCADLLDHLPDALPSAGDGLARRQLAEPAPAGAAAWGDTDPVVLRCGVPKPPALTPTSPLRVVNEVQWLPISGDGASTWYAVDRKVYIALTIPGDTGTGPLQRISTVLADAVPAAPVEP